MTSHEVDFERRWLDGGENAPPELRSALRDRTIVINSVVLPFILYPVVLWAVFSGILFPCRT